MSTCQTPSHVVGSLDATTAAPSRGHKRPLRTYSRRTTQTRTQEQEATQTDGEPNARSSCSESVKSSDQHPESPALRVEPNDEEENQSDRLSRGSILAYFKPVPAGPDEALFKNAPFESAEPPPIPPASPPSARAKKRRRLTTRPRLDGLERQLPNDIGGSIEVGQGVTAAKTGVGQQRSPSINETAILMRPTHDALRQALGEVAANNSSHQDGTTRDSADGRMNTKKRPYKRSRRDMTQTTLSLSVHKEPGFTICSVCDVLYNPLNEKDRREHSRRHAAFSRRRRRTA